MSFACPKPSETSERATGRLKPPKRSSAMRIEYVVRSSSLVARRESCSVPTDDTFVVPPKPQAGASTLEKWLSVELKVGAKDVVAPVAQLLCDDVQEAVDLLLRVTVLLASLDQPIAFLRRDLHSD